jgi:hypothetical protein
MIRRTRDLAAAEQEAAAALSEYGAASPEFESAALKQVEAQAAATAAILEFRDEIGVTGDQFRAILGDMGVTSEEVIDSIITQFDRVNAYRFSQKSVGVMINGNWSTGQKPSGMPESVWTSLPKYASGGRVSGGPIQVGEAGPEVFVPGQDGRIIPNHSLSRPGVSPSVNITVNAGAGTDPLSLGRAVVDALQTYTRLHGPLPIEVHR